MIIPVRCFSCGNVIGNKWEQFSAEIDKINTDDLKNDNKPIKNILDNLKLKRYCCRRMMLGHVDLIDKI